MNSGLPSLLDAIFGKQNLALVSLDEIYEVIKEFPSFNAGHFLLAKKLKLQDDPGYEMESMRTALYFNNPFWLQSLLEDVNHFQPVESLSFIAEKQGEEQFNFDEEPEETPDTRESGNYTFESYTPIEQPVSIKDELDQETEEILQEKMESDPVRSEDTFQYAEPGSQTVTSFDELMAKYNIQPLDFVDETAETPKSDLPVKENVPSEREAVPAAQRPVVEMNPDKSPVSDGDQHEMTEEIVNEYGIFEETVVKKEDHAHDIDGFDEPLDQIPFVSDKIIEQPIPAGQAEGSADDSSNADDIAVDGKAVNAQDEAGNADDVAFDGNAANSVDEAVNGDHIPFDTNAANTQESTTEDNTRIVENAAATEYQESEDPPHKTDEHDYESFDRPREEPVQIEVPVEDNENSDELPDYDPDSAGEAVDYSNDSENGANSHMEELSERFGEHQKKLSAFNAKNTDSIVFTPYHMVDYFASQGIRLILEDNPPDQFGKQLKSFTDWLKVMKKLPPKSSSDKQDEKENERIRHYAAHSIEERDILTESMAEVLAKQGMYENAIALFQKLSLIYPPKSAYFASRIEQLKASLP
jgi:hypothetical protein